MMIEAGEDDEENGEGERGDADKEDDAALRCLRSTALACTRGTHSATRARVHELPTISPPPASAVGHPLDSRTTGALGHYWLPLEASDPNSATTVPHGSHRTMPESLLASTPR